MLSNLKISKPSIFFALFLFLAQFFNSFGATRTGELSNHSYFWFVFAFFWALSWWVINDSKIYGIKWFDKDMDMGMYLYVGWALLLPYYLFKTHGWKAVFTIGLFFIAYISAEIIGTVTYLFLNLF